MPNVFNYTHEEFFKNALPYNYFWNSAEIIMRANTTQNEIIKVRDNLISYIDQNLNLKYLVRDWVDPYCNKIFNI